MKDNKPVWKEEKVHREIKDESLKLFVIVKTQNCFSFFKIIGQLKLIQQWYNELKKPVCKKTHYHNQETNILNQAIIR